MKFWPLVGLKLGLKLGLVRSARAKPRARVRVNFGICSVLLAVEFVVGSPVNDVARV